MLGYILLSRLALPSNAVMLPAFWVHYLLAVVLCVTAQVQKFPKGHQLIKNNYVTGLYILISVAAMTVSSFVNFVITLEKKLGYQTEIKWKTVLTVGFYHFLGCYWCYQYAFPAKWQSIAFAYLMLIINGLGITCGVHRLFTHRSYKAKLPLRLLLMLSFASCGQNSIYDWVRDHRQHHKFSDTEMDPHNVNRGFFFSHIGWLMLKKNSSVLEKGRLIDMTDIENDPLLVFDRKYSILLRTVLCYLVPTLTGILLWGEDWKCAIAWQCFIRVLIVLHCEMTVNSFAHIYGYRPYNNFITPTQNRIVAAITLGEGWHNYHHEFPYDYKAAEFFDLLSLSTLLISTAARIGQAYDLKEPTPELIKAVIRKRGSAMDNGDYLHNRHKKL